VYEISLGPFCVLFCGDGANDMSALRAADVGVSLCDAETSVAAPITSKMQTPGSVIDVLLEGRCSLVSAYVLVIYMIYYGVIQLFMALELYSFGLIPSDYTYLIQDLFFSLVLGIAVALTERADELSWQLPPKRFLVWWLLFKLASQILTFVTFQILAIYLLTLQSWYVPYTPTDTPLVDSYAYESTVVANVALSQLMIGSVVATIGSPFRKAWYTNFWHILALFLQSIWVSYQIFQTGDEFATDWLSLEPLPFDFSLMLVGLIAGNVAVSTVLYYVAECFRPQAKRQIIGQLDVMEAVATVCAKERLELDAASRIATATAATAPETKPNIRTDSDASPLLAQA
jgi:cation-transporting ATPase 13A3/4/5